MDVGQMLYCIMAPRSQVCLVSVHDISVMDDDDQLEIYERVGH
jgi:hypothetical protein